MHIFFQTASACVRLMQLIYLEVKTVASYTSYFANIAIFVGGFYRFNAKANTYTKEKTAYSPFMKCSCFIVSIYY